MSALIAGICAGTDDDEERIARGSTALDGFYAHFTRRRGLKMEASARAEIAVETLHEHGISFGEGGARLDQGRAAPSADRRDEWR